MKSTTSFPKNKSLVVLYSEKAFPNIYDTKQVYYENLFRDGMDLMIFGIAKVGTNYAKLKKV